MSHAPPPGSRVPAPGLIFAGFLLTSAVALATVFVFQFGFGILPCILCLWQRLPHAIAILLGGIGFGLSRAADPARQRFRATPWATYTALAGLLLIDYLANTGLAAFHIGVEQHWWAGTEACTGGAATGLSAEQLSAQLMATPIAHCDQIAWSLFGISLAGFNFILSFALSIASAGTLLRFNAVRTQAAKAAQ
jgi:disulfide bond formation protein DsbB